MFPQASQDWPFFVRGMGEEFSDVWLRLFKGGKVILRAGPFEDEVGSAIDRGEVTFRYQMRPFEDALEDARGSDSDDDDDAD